MTDLSIYNRHYCGPRKDIGSQNPPTSVFSYSSAPLSSLYLLVLSVCLCSTTSLCTALRYLFTSDRSIFTNEKLAVARR